MGRRALVPVTVVVAVVAVLLLARDPAPDLTPPPRPDGVHVLDPAGVLGDPATGALARDLDTLAASGWDVVAVAYTSPQASEGEAQRGGRAVLEAWGADVVLVAVAVPGGFADTAEDRRRYFGIEAGSVRAVPARLREDITEEVVAPLAAENDWSAALQAAAAELAAALPER